MIRKLRLINYLLSKLKNMKEKIFPSYKMNEHEQVIYGIVEKILQSPTTSFKVAPRSGSYYISNEVLGYNIKLSYKEIIIVNHVNSVQKQFSLEFHEVLMDVASKYIEDDRMEFEKEIFKGELEILRKIESKL